MVHTTLLNALEPTGPARLLAGLLEIADDAVIVADELQRVVVFNQGAERIFGLAASVVLGQPIDVLLPEAARPAHRRHMAGFAQAPQASRRMGERREITGRRGDGSSFDAEASITRLHIGGQSWYAAILRDVSTSRQAQRELAASEARFRGLAAAAPVGIFQADGMGQVVYVNDRWCQIAGMDAQEARGQGWLRALHPADRARVLTGWQAAQLGAAPFEQRFRFLRPDGSEAWVLGNAVPTPASGGGPGTAGGGLIGTITDVSASHQQAVALEEAKAEAEAAARAKSLFLANMSHEIRTPLNAVIGMTTLLQGTPMNEDQRDFARTIRASGEALLEIINDILDYSKAEVGKLELEQQAFDLRRCIEDALDLVAPRALDKSLNLACLIEDGTPEALVGDVTRIRQILVNLLSNAVKFTAQGEVLVTVDSQPGAEAGQHRLRLAVKDTGIGIAGEDLPRLFQSFSQVDASTTRRFGGTGLGLAISKRLAEAMGGTLTVQSRPGQGSTFSLTLTLPAAGEAEPADFLQRDVPALAGRRLLVVDDNLTNRRILTKLALRWGMVPSTLPSALEALDRIRHGEAFDVAVLDVSMPDMDGPALAAEIRRRRSAAELPIVLLTSLGARGEGQSGADACLAKPIKAGQLYATLVTVLAGGAAEGGGSALPDLPGSASPLSIDASAQASAGGRAREGAGPPRASSPRATSLAPRPQALRVLVAEDNRTNQMVALRLLQHLGYAADMAANGLEVLAALQRQPYDVVLMDIQMPEMDGLAAARHIVARRGPAARPRIVAMTANAMPGDREAYLAAGMDGYVSKPIELEELAAALGQVALYLGSLEVVATAQAGADDRSADSGAGADAAPGLDGPMSPLQAAAAAPPPGVDAEQLDLRRLDQLSELQSDSQPSLVRELIDLFVADAPAQVAALNVALQAGDLAALRRIAHRLLSATQNIGAVQMSACCAALEATAQAGQAEGLAPLLHALNRSTPAVTAALQAARLRY